MDSNHAALLQGRLALAGCPRRIGVCGRTRTGNLRRGGARLRSSGPFLLRYRSAFEATHTYPGLSVQAVMRIYLPHCHRFLTVTPAATARLSVRATVLSDLPSLELGGRLSGLSCVALSALPTSDHRGFIDPAKGARRAAAGGGIRPRVLLLHVQHPHGRPSVRAVMRLFRFRIVTASLAAWPSVRLPCVFSALPQVGCCAPARGKPGAGRGSAGMIRRVTLGAVTAPAAA